MFAVTCHHIFFSWILSYRIAISLTRTTKCFTKFKVFKRNNRGALAAVCILNMKSNYWIAVKKMDENEDTHVFEGLAFAVIL